jgi:hypothetical protein
MRDFTFSAYQYYLNTLKSWDTLNLRIDEYLASSPKPQAFFIIRHDVDRRPRKALHMAQMESAMEIRATYYFRSKPHVFKPEIITTIADMGHEIGYHYESLCDTKGDVSMALEDFERNLAKFRRLVTVSTVAMHGRPLSPFDSRDLWRSVDHRKLLSRHYQILGEAYLDIDYSGIVYLTDTGRNWSPSRANKRDRVESKSIPEPKTMEDLLRFLKTVKPSKFVLQVHPERWAESFPEYLFCSGMDYAVNWLKKLAK